MHIYFELYFSLTNNVMSKGKNTWMTFGLQR